MTWGVVWTRPAVDDLRRLDRKLTDRIRAAVRRFATTGHGDVKRLQGIDPPEWRLRVGDWRVLFVFDHPTSTLHVLHVLSRGDAY